MKSFDERSEILKTILIFIMVACLVTGLMVLIYLYGCQPASAAESTYFNQKMVEVSRQRSRTRRPIRRQPQKRETVFIAPAVFITPAITKTSKTPTACSPADAKTPTACSPADDGTTVRKEVQADFKPDYKFYTLPKAPVRSKVKFKTRAR